MLPRAGRQKLTTYQDRETQIISTYQWTGIKPFQIGYREIFRAVMHRDFRPLQAPISDYVYFVNRTRNIILHMYDDRGLDMIAPQINDLRPIYDTHKAWILDYDRKQIEEMFARSEEKDFDRPEDSES